MLAQISQQFTSSESNSTADLRHDPTLDVYNINIVVLYND